MNGMNNGMNNNMNNMNMQNMQNMNMNMNGMNGMNAMNGMNRMNGMTNMNGTNGMNLKMNAAGQYPMGNMGQPPPQQQQQHFSGIPGQQQPPPQPQRGQGPQQVPQQFIMQGMGPQFQRVPQGIPPQGQPPQQQPLSQGQPQGPQTQPPSASSAHFPETQFNGQSGQIAPQIIMTNPQHPSTSTGPSPAVLQQQQQQQQQPPLSATTINGTTPVVAPQSVPTPSSAPNGAITPSTIQRTMLAGGAGGTGTGTGASRPVMRSGATPQDTTTAPSTNSGTPVTNVNNVSGVGVMPATTATAANSGTNLNGMGMLMNGNGNGNVNANAVLNYRRQVTNTETLKFLDFCELVGVRSESTKNILYWKKIITEYFSETGVLQYSVKAGGDSRQFEFSVPIIPRFFFSIIQSGVTRIEIQPGMLRTQVLPNGTTYLESPRCCFTHHYADGSYVNIHGSMKGILNQALRIDWLDFQTHVFIPGVEWPSLEKLLSDETKMKDILEMLNEPDSSPSLKSNNNSGDGSLGPTGKDEKSGDPKKLKILQKFRSNFGVFHSMSNFGLQESVMRVMQVSDVMAHLRSLMTFSITSSTTGPLQALDEFVSQNQKKGDGATPNGKSGASTNAKGSGANLSSMGTSTTATGNNNNSNTAGGNTATTNATTTTTATANTSTNNNDTPSSTTNNNNSTTTTTTATTTNNNTSNGTQGQKKTEPVSQKNSPLPDATAGSPQLRVGKLTTLDLSQSTLNKRRRKSTVGELSPKSVVESQSPKAKKKSKR